MKDRHNIEVIERLVRERDEARAEIERLRAATIPRKKVDALVRLVESALIDYRLRWDIVSVLEDRIRDALAAIKEKV